MWEYGHPEERLRLGGEPTDGFTPSVAGFDSWFGRSSCFAWWWQGEAKHFGMKQSTRWWGEMPGCLVGFMRAAGAPAWCARGCWQDGGPVSPALGGPCPRARLGKLHGAASRAGGKEVASNVSLDLAGTCCWVSQREGPEVPRGSSAGSSRARCGGRGCFPAASPAKSPLPASPESRTRE